MWTPSPSRAGRARLPASASACPRQKVSPGARRSPPSVCRRSRPWRITASRQGEGVLVCAAMDARRSQIYNALFEIRDGKPRRLCQDRAISLAELGAELKKMQKSVFLVGDGAQLCYNTCLDMGIPAVLAPGNLVVQSAWGVAMAAFGRRLPRRRSCSRSICACRRPSRERQARLAAEAEKRLKVKYGCNKGDDEMSKVHVFDHPLIQHKLSILRDKHTSVKEFRELISEIAMLMCFEATRDLPLEEIDVETPVATAHCKHIAGKKLAIVPILRAGLRHGRRHGHHDAERQGRSYRPVPRSADARAGEVLLQDAARYRRARRHHRRPHARHRRQRVCCGKIHEGSRLQAHQAHVHHWCARGACR